MHKVNLLDRSTHRNVNAPRLDPSLNDELINIVGLNAFGEPNARFAWGQSTMRFQWGKDRLAYIDTRIPAIRHTRHTLKRVAFVEPKTSRRVKNVTPDGFIEYETINSEIPHYETKVLTEPPRTAIPEGWFYELELVNLEWIGEQLFYFEQYYPPEHFGSEAQWERVRWQRWPMKWRPEPDVEVIPVGSVEQALVREGQKVIQKLPSIMVDALGPFPRQGDYRARWVIGEPYDYERPVLAGPKGMQYTVLVPDSHFGYKAPDRETLEVIRESWQTREHEKEMTPEQLSRSRFIAQEEEDARKGEENVNRLGTERVESKLKGLVAVP